MRTKNSDLQPTHDVPAAGAADTPTPDDLGVPPAGRDVTPLTGTSSPAASSSPSAATASAGVSSATAPSVGPSGGAPRFFSRVGATWVFLFFGMVLLILLLVFVLQNLDRVSMTLFVWQLSFPLGVGMLFAAITGALIMALIGSIRIIQLRRQVTRSSHSQPSR